MGLNLEIEGRSGGDLRDARRVDKSTLMSGLRIDRLPVPPGVTVERTQAPLGTILRGIDLADDLPGEVIGLIVTLANHSGVLIIPGQTRLTPQRHQEVATWFGRIYNRATEVDDIPCVAGTRVQQISSVGEELVWHSDVQDYAITPNFTLLRATEMPPHSAGGDTLFANLFQAYDELDDQFKQQVAHLRWKPAVTLQTAYAVGMKSARDYLNSHGMTAAQMAALESDVVHPVVRIHPVSGRKALWVSSFTVKLVGIEDAGENRTLVEFLKRQVMQPHLAYTHRWSNHDLIIWDNRCTNHWRQNWDHSYPRVMQRCQAGGSRPF
ncbi:MAG TPA: TauD/TfdA family dioxygenase [Candidatus Binataceae bacterium]|nr:TauD/TfdA family dioxygenase [Candidatus Binataceae bacterium]